MNDLISRQAAIDDAHRQIWYRMNPNMKERIDTWLTGLPSVQPEITMCKDCDWWTKLEDSLQGRCARYSFYPTGYWYCAGAKRREDGLN